MNVNNYDTGDAIIMAVTFIDPNTDLPTDPAGVPGSPGEISISVRDPSGNIAKYIYGTNPEVLRTAKGMYEITILVDEAGTWTYRWVALNFGQEEKQLNVKAGVIAQVT